MGGPISETSSDTPEQIISCLNCTYSECINCFSSKRTRPELPILQIDLATGEVIHRYRTVPEASSITGISKDSIYKCISGIKHSAGGFCWDRLAPIPRQRSNK